MNKADRAANYSSCEMPIRIENQGTINIYNCPPVTSGPFPLPPGEPQECPPTLPPTGACLPLALGSKPKQSLEDRLRPLLEKPRIVSILPSAFFQIARRFLLSRNPANELESAAFGVFQKMSPEVKDILSCALQTFDALPVKDREALFGSELTGSAEQVVEPAQLAELVSNELVQRTSLEAFGDTGCLTEAERPGQVRVFEVGDEEIGSVLFPTICRLNGLRTNTFEPQLSLSEYRSEELQQVCTPETVNGQVQLNCQVLTEDCPGNEIEGACLRVPEVQPGEAVTLQGYNFFNTEARVRLEAKAPGTVSREVDAHVCGDISTPLTEVADGEERTIVDCRVQDILVFRVPEDLPVGIYGITVVVPNNTGLPEFGSDDEFKSSGLQFIEVVPPATATFQIAGERLDCVLETAAPVFRNAGSDEVGIKILTVPIGLDLTPGEVIEHNFEFGDVDSGENRGMNRVLFQASNLAGVSMSIIGFEIDNRDVFEKQIREFSDAYIEILRSNWQAIAASIGTLGGLIAGALGLSFAWATAVAAAITEAIHISVALWAPADLIIEDSAAFTTRDLGALTSPNFPPPPVVEFTSAGGIDVKVEPVTKGVQYIERRRYRSNEQDSEYHITLRYNRL